MTTTIRVIAIGSFWHKPNNPKNGIFYWIKLSENGDVPLEIPCVGVRMAAILHYHLNRRCHIDIFFVFGNTAFYYNKRTESIAYFNDDITLKLLNYV